MQATLITSLFLLACVAVVGLALDWDKVWREDLDSDGNGTISLSESFGGATLFLLTFALLNAFLYKFIYAIYICYAEKIGQFQDIPKHPSTFSEFVTAFQVGLGALLFLFFVSFFVSYFLSQTNSVAKDYLIDAMDQDGDGDLDGDDFLANVDRNNDGRVDSTEAVRNCLLILDDIISPFDLTFDTDFCF